jgi:hypothetical protein
MRRIARNIGRGGVCAWVFASSAALAQPALPPPPAGVQVTTSYGMEFSTVGYAGNRATTQAEAPHLFPPYSMPATPVGAVDHAYRIARTELPASQWLEFANGGWHRPKPTRATDGSFGPSVVGRTATMAHRPLKAGMPFR